MYLTFFLAFSGLNSLFNDLLYRSTNLHLNFTRNCNYHILPISLNVNRLRSLKLSNTFLFSIENFFRQYPLESFEQLRSFTLMRLRIKDNIDNIVKLEHLSSLILYLDDDNSNGHKIFEQVFNGPLSSRLKRFELHQSSINKTPVKVRCQHGLSIEHLCFNTQFQYNNNFIQLLSFMPRIKSITIGPLWIQQKDDNISPAIDFQIIPTSIPTLFYLNLTLSSVKFSHLEAFLSKYTPNLKYLLIKTTDNNFANGEKWEILFHTSLTRLKHFYLEITYSIYYSIDSFIDMTKFQTNYWLDRNIVINKLNNQFIVKF